MRYVSSSLAIITTTLGLAFSSPARAQVPSPYALASQLDLECRSAQGAPPVDELRIRQLNPVLQGVLPNQKTKLGQLEEVCVPVAKNGQIPSQPARDIIRAVDLACYKAEAPPVDVDVFLSHMNPVLAHLPDEFMHLTRLEQVCVPVGKNGVTPPPEILPIVRRMDFACYGFVQPTSNANTNVLLSHLNPVLVQQGVPNHVVQMERAHQLCVPIAKEQQVIPPVALNLVQWIDFLKYRITPVAGPLAPLPLTLHHLNPLFAGAPPFHVTLLGNPRLLVPVAKNGVFPPGAPD